ncbi:hypothetical protein D9613_000718 [Agrocybe pediades]|uniref:Uncharacterized protein n=1 Tax=Agrocybe pediades TaxID=84607 RepID=A0A8H4R0Y5_9AGAR|nr:hypothetical protein D9613_000718 [Agrocybe pediades]
MARTCPSDNAAAVDQSSFWEAGNIHWDDHRIGWAIAGGSTVVTLIISSITVLSHCRYSLTSLNFLYMNFDQFKSFSVALYGLLIFYALTRDDLVGKRPLAKFLCIKLIVMFTFYQSFVFSALQGRVIHGTEFWTATNISNGLNALAICIEMIFFSIFMWWAYPAREYKEHKKRTSIWRPLWDSINYSDFLREMMISLKFFFKRQDKGLRRSNTTKFDYAFQLEGPSRGGSQRSEST